MVRARTNFIQQLSSLQKQAAATGMAPTEAAQRLSVLVINWAKEAKLADGIGSWLDGAGGRRSILRQ